jgi:hypothetical protein
MKVNKTIITQIKLGKGNKSEIQIRHTHGILRIICDINGANFIIFLYNLNMINLAEEYHRESYFSVTRNAHKLYRV